MKITWDPAKNEQNVRKHHIAFEDAQYVFADPLALTREDNFEHEQRRQIIGWVGGFQIVVVVYTELDKQDEIVLRIISARKATSQEKKLYEQGRWVPGND